MANIAQIAPVGQPQAGTIHWLNTHIELGKTTPHAEVTTLTPGLAAEILKANPDNRNITQVKLRHYVTAMQRGLWPLNGETIIISREGLLNDGQHRCMAVVESNTSIPATIFFGADRETRSTVDMGSARTAAHLLGMDGLPNAAHRGAIARFILAFEESNGRSVQTANHFSSFENYQRAKNDEGIGDAARYTGSHAAQLRLIAQPAVVGAALYVLGNICQADAKAYIDQIVGGENIQRGDPAYAVRARLQSMPARNPHGKFEVILRGWNSYRQGKKLAMVQALGTLPELI